MRMIFRIFFIFAICCVGNFFADVANAARVNPISEYGQIQNVQNYSSNPLWNPNGPYNQTFPRPVYVDGPDLNSGDCQRTVFALIGSYCMANDNCHGMQLSDIRPSIMLQLSRLPGHNWATQCIGYIDGAFDEYMSSAQNHVPSTAVEFPQGTVPSNPPAQFKIKNPFAPQIPDWAIEMQERKQELKQLQSQTNNYDASLTHSSFPGTYQDLSFREKIDIQQQGYEPYKDKSPYVPIKIDEHEPKSTTAHAVQSTTQGLASGQNSAAATAVYQQLAQELKQERAKLAAEMKKYQDSNQSKELLAKIKEQDKQLAAQQQTIAKIQEINEQANLSAKEKQEKIETLNKYLDWGLIAAMPFAASLLGSSVKEFIKSD